MEKKRILCLDLDGTVRRSKSGKTFIEGPDDIELMPGIFDLIWKYNDEGWIIIYVSNQGGIAYGIKTEEVVEEEIHNTFKLLMKSPDEYAPYFGCYFCSSMSNGKIAKYTWRSLGRKPNYGMLVSAENDLVEAGFIPDWDNSLFVGDRPEDEGCANAAGVPFMHIDEFLKQPL